MGVDHRAVVAQLAYKPGWTFKIGGPNGRFLCVMAHTIDSQNHARTRHTQHMFELPADGFGDDREAARWVFEHLLDIERHETAEFFTLDGFAPFFPNHQDEGSPYEHVERWETTPC